MNNAVAAKRVHLSKIEVMEILDSCNKATKKGVTKDGSLLHFEYHRMAGAKTTAIQTEEAKVAGELGLKSDRYTGRLDDVKISASGDTIVVMYVELERDGKYRSFNIDKGHVYVIKKME